MRTGRGCECCAGLKENVFSDLQMLLQCGVLMLNNAQELHNEVHAFVRWRNLCVIGHKKDEDLTVTIIFDLKNVPTWEENYF